MPVRVDGSDALRPSGGAVVVVVDDCSLMLRLAARTLHAHEVHGLVSPAEALLLLDRRNDVDVFICETHLQRASSIEIIAEVCRRRPELAPGIVMTTTGCVRDDEHAFLTRFKGPIVRKPFVCPHLAVIVGELVARVRLDAAAPR